MKKIVTAIAVATLALSLTACTKEITHTLEDGRTMTCLTKDPYAITCDWANAK